MIEGRSQDKTSDHIVMEYIKQLFSILLVVPVREYCHLIFEIARFFELNCFLIIFFWLQDHSPDDAVLPLIRSLINKLLKYSWAENNSARVALYIQGLHVLSVAYQSQYPYHFLNGKSASLLCNEFAKVLISGKYNPQQIRSFLYRKFCEIKYLLQFFSTNSVLRIQ